MADDAERFVALTSKGERQHLKTFAELEEHLMSALAARQQTVVLELPVLSWLTILDEIRDRRPRNLTRLLADDSMDRFASMAEALCDQMHAELTRFAVQLDGMEAAIAGRGQS